MRAHQHGRTGPRAGGPAAQSAPGPKHLWYLTEEIAVLSLFDDDVDKETKLKMVANLHRENCHSV